MNVIKGKKMENNVKIIFFGSSYFSDRVLMNLIKLQYDIAAVVTQHNSLLEKTAQNYNIEIIESKNINSHHKLNEIKEFDSDVFIVVSYGKILSENLLNIPKIGAFNVHASLLPSLRGASPIQQALINGDKKTGISIIKMNKYMDEGPILAQKEIEIDKNDNFITLENRLINLTNELLIAQLPLIATNNYNLKLQNNESATYTSLIKKEDGKINFCDTAEIIVRKIKAYIKWPTSYMILNNKLIKIIDANYIENIDTYSKYEVGQIVGVTKCVIIKCNKGFIKINKLQAEGKKVLNVEDFLNGFKIKIGDRCR